MDRKQPTFFINIPYYYSCIEHYHSNVYIIVMVKYRPKLSVKAYTLDIADSVQFILIIQCCNIDNYII